MHTRRYQWTIVTLIAATTLAIGCRGARPLGNLVQMSKTPEEVDVPKVEAPQQRLAVNKPQSGRIGSLDKISPKSDSNPHVGLSSSRQATDKSSSRRRPTSDTIDVNLATQRKPPAGQTAATRKEDAKPVAQNIASTSGRITDMTEEEMSKAFDDQPEEVKRLAMRQLIASIKASAESTDQPKGVGAAIAGSLDQLPELPESSGEPKVPAQRIASNEPAGDSIAAPPEAAAKSKMAEDVDEKLSKIQSGNPATTASISDSPPSNLESVVVQSISDNANEGEVKPVSASRRSDQDPMVTQANVEPTAATAERSSASVTALSDQTLYAELLQRLSKAQPGESEAQRAGRLIKQRHLMVLAGDPDAAVQKIEEMSEQEQEYLRHQLLGLWTMVDPDGHPVPSRRFTTALPQLREATKFAAAATDSLDVRSLAFCTAIESYGQIKTFPGNRFDAGQRVILYCEVENFTVGKTSEGFETHLQGSYDIYNDKNEKVVSQLLPADKQVSANYLRDYFIAYQMHLPQQLTPGTYRLQLTMEDVTGKKYGQASIPLEIAKK